MQNIAYVRVSSLDQNTERQLSDCGVALDKTFTDKLSGATTERPELLAMLDYAREGDCIHVHSIDRLARSLVDLQGLISQLNTKGVAVHFHKESLVFSGDANPMNDLLLNMLGAVAQFERATILERQREGIVKAKAAGKYKGRKANTANHDQIKKLLDSGMSVRKVALEIGCNPSTVQRVKAKARS
ncbi:recombinase family protein [Shewanella saliphila]|uniref:Resolvase n=1 Tax=Shewanella saliphila TaxID=2282698 RepID=A0ABQ2QDD3_9GAMM|nr:recombinase family protein [Shewanella saliphila]MCL1103346.1 recombinase family protein [Shewanella saliphila]GGP71824.1 resolvase [Shewanella saliphila]